MGAGDTVFTTALFEIKKKKAGNALGIFLGREVEVELRTLNMLASELQASH